MTSVIRTAPPPVSDGGEALIAWLRRMRKEAPVCKDKKTGIWQAFRRADVLRIMSDTEAFSSDILQVVPESKEFARGNIMLTDPPDHRKLRRIVSAAFTPKVVRDLEPRIRQIATSLLRNVSSERFFDFVQHFTYPLPMMVIAELLGIPKRDWAGMRGMSEAQVAVAVDGPIDEDFLKSVELIGRDFNGYLAELCRARREAPRDDLMSRLVQAEVDGERLTDEEIVNFAGLLFLAGHLTTTVMLGNTLLCFNEFPDALRDLRANPSLLRPVIDEVMRYRSPFTQVGRVTKHDVELSGIVVPAGQMILAWTLSANRDEEEIQAADLFDIHRGINPHIAFGRGIHYCLGAPLAYLEAEIAIPMILEEFSEIKVGGIEDMEFYELGIFGPKALPIQVER
ncbi:cytochrome P450 [Streptomyces regalis]|uniref:cytochrome P450 n=1 Tax=Streptomyces regalis TaxID=68262 RepID=UPI0007C69DD3|nr:cytochrome P450 [Streptomyces regalis]